MKRNLIFALLLLALGTAAHADVITWDGNGHGYKVVTGDTTLSWMEAKAAAEAMGGHLATITSEDENDFVTMLLVDLGFGVGDLQRYWLGGYQPPPRDDEPDGGWAWVTGEDWEYTNWAPNEPNNGVGGTQHYLHYWPEAGLWDDMENRNIMDSFIVEFPNRVSEPGLLGLFGAGLLAFGIARRRRRSV